MNEETILDRSGCCLCCEEEVRKGYCPAGCEIVIASEVNAPFIWCAEHPSRHFGCRPTSVVLSAERINVGPSPATVRSAPARREESASYRAAMRDAGRGRGLAMKGEASAYAERSGR